MKFKFCKSLVILCLIPGFAFAGVSVSAPDVADNGALVQVDVAFSPPLLKGEQAVVLIEEKEAMRLVNDNVGAVSKLSSRFKMSKTGDIVVSVSRKNNISELARRNVQVKIGRESGGVPTIIVKDRGYKERISAGVYKALAAAPNGFGNTLVLEDARFKVYLTGSNLVSENPYIGIEGNFTNGLRSSFIDKPPAILQEVKQTQEAPTTISPVITEKSADESNVSEPYVTEIIKRGDEFVLGTGRRGLAEIYFSSMSEKELLGTAKHLVGNRANSSDPFEDKRMEQKHKQYIGQIAKRLKAASNGMLPNDVELNALVRLKDYDFNASQLKMEACYSEVMDFNNISNEGRSLRTKYGAKDGDHELHCFPEMYSADLRKNLQSDLRKFISENNLPNLITEHCTGFCNFGKEPSNILGVSVQTGYSLAVDSDKAESLFQTGYGHKYNISMVDFPGSSNWGKKKRSVLYARIKLSTPEIETKVSDFYNITNMSMSFKIAKICLYDTQNMNGAPLFCSK